MASIRSSMEPLYLRGRALFVIFLVFVLYYLQLGGAVPAQQGDGAARDVGLSQWSSNSNNHPNSQSSWSSTWSSWSTWSSPWSTSEPWSSWSTWSTFEPWSSWSTWSSRESGGWGDWGDASWDQWSSSWTASGSVAQHAPPAREQRGGRPDRADQPDREENPGRVRAAGFYRHGQWVGRQRTDEEQRFHDGGQGSVRQGKRRERAEQWARGEFVPAWRRAMQTTPGASSSSQPNWAELLNKHHEPLQTPSPSTWDAPPPAADEQDWKPPSGMREPMENPAREEIEEDHTSCSLSSVGELDGDEDLDENPGQGQDAGQMPPSWTSKQWTDWEDAVGGTDDDDGAFMQLSMSEEAEIHNLGIYDEGRRELRGMLRELSNLETM